MKQLVNKAVRDKVGSSKLTETFKQAYDYIIGECVILLLTNTVAGRTITVDKAWSIIPNTDKF